MVDVTSGAKGLMPNITANGLLHGLMIFCIAVIIMAAIGWLIIYIVKIRKYREFKAVIWERDSTGNVHESYDRGGIFVDKGTGLKLLFFSKIRKGLNPNSVPFVTAKDKKGRLIKIVYLRRVGVSNYVFCHVKVTETGTVIKVGEEDINWATQDIIKVRRSFLKEGWLQKFAPYIAFIITILVVMIILISLFNKMGVIEKASDNMVIISEKQLEITQTLLNLTEKTNQFQQTIPVIVPGGG